MCGQPQPVTAMSPCDLAPNTAPTLGHGIVESRSTRRAVRMAPLWRRPLLLVAAVAAAQAPERRTDAALPNGLVVVIEDKPEQPRLNLRALDKPFLSGVALQIHWADLEPSEGKPNWTKLDQLFAAADSSKKWVQLLIFPGFFTPSWALQGVQTEQFPIEYGPGHGTMLPLPMPWDKVYLTRWFAFMKLVSDRYGNSPAFRVMAAAGPTSVSVEATLPFTPDDIKKWQAVSYRPSKYIRGMADGFPDICRHLPQAVHLAVTGIWPPHQRRWQERPQGAKADLSGDPRCGHARGWTPLRAAIEQRPRGPGPARTQFGKGRPIRHRVHWARTSPGSSCAPRPCRHPA